MPLARPLPQATVWALGAFALVELATFIILGWVAAVTLLTVLIIFWLPSYLILSRWVTDETDRVFLSFPLGLLVVSLLTFYLNLVVPSLRLSLAIVVVLLLVLGWMGRRSRTGRTEGSAKGST